MRGPRSLWEAWPAYPRVRIAYCGGDTSRGYVAHKHRQPPMPRDEWASRVIHITLPTLHTKIVGEGVNYRCFYVYHSSQSHTYRPVGRAGGCDGPPGQHPRARNLPRGGQGRPRPSVARLVIYQRCKQMTSRFPWKLPLRRPKQHVVAGALVVCPFAPLISGSARSCGWG